MVCRKHGCGCGFVSDTFTISEESPGVWRFEQAELSDLTELIEDVADLQATVAAQTATIADLTDRLAAVEADRPRLLRHGCLLTRVGMPLPAAGPTSITWTAESEDTDGYHTGSSSSIIVPAGLDGIYVISGRIQRAAGNWGTSYMQVVIGGTAFPIPTTGTGLSAFAYAYPLAAGTAVSIQVYNGDAATSLNAVVSMYRIPEVLAP